MVPACALAGLLIVKSYERERASLQRGTVVTAHALLQAVDLEFSNVEAALKTLATSRLLTSGDLPAFYSQAQEVAKIIGVDVTILVDPAGRQILNTRRSPGAAPTASGNSEKLQLVFSTGKPMVSDLFVDPLAGGFVVEVAVPVVREGKIAYALAMTIPPEHFVKLLQRQRIPPDWVVAIFDSRGKIVARTRGQEQFVGKDGALPLLRRMTEVSEGSIEVETLEGIPVLSSFSRSPTSGWTVAIGVPASTLTAELNRSVWISAILAGLMLVLAAMAAALVGQRIGRSIRALGTRAMAVAAGEPQASSRLDIAEVVDVQNALDTASQLIVRRAEDREKILVAEQKRTMADREAARLSTFLEAAPDAMIVVRSNGIISFANHQAEAIFGYSRSELLEHSVEILLPSRLGANHEAHMHGFFAAATARVMGPSLDLLGRRKDGSEFPVEVRLSPLEFEGEAKVIAAVRDLTERKRLETQLEASRMQMVASARLSSLGAVAGGIAHEVNNPLAVIHVLASDLMELAEDGHVTPVDVLKSSRRIVEYSDRIGRIVTSMRALSRDGGRDVMDRASLKEIVERALDLLAERFRMQSVTLTVDPIDPALSIACREVQISQVLTNLLQNALDAVHEQQNERWVRLVVVARGDRVTISVIDSGSGISPELKARIMDPFFTTKPVGKGTGLGLSLSKQIVEEHNGTLEVGERDGHTCFTLSFPVSGRERDNATEGRDSSDCRG